MKSYLLPLLVLLTGCSGALVSEETEAFPDMAQLDDGDWIALFIVFVGVDSNGRDAQTELEMNVGGIAEDGLAIDVELLSGPDPVSVFEPDAHDGDVAIVHEPDFAACDGFGYAETADGGCDATFTGAVTLSADADPRVGFILRSDDNAVELTLSISEVRPE